EVAASCPGPRRAEASAERLTVPVHPLARAGVVAAGRSAKQVVAARVAVEARLLLACTDEPVAAVGRRLGFTEPTNFGRFFVRETGLTPGEFRACLVSGPLSGLVSGPGAGPGSG